MLDPGPKGSQRKMTENLLLVLDVVLFNCFVFDFFFSEIPEREEKTVIKSI